MILISYFGCVLLYLFVDGDLYRNPGFTAWIVWYAPYVLGFLIFGMGVELEIKARRAQRETKEKDSKE
jgi:hypothetical protein